MARGRGRGRNNSGEPRRAPEPRRPQEDRPKALEAKGGIRAESRQGDFGSTWWAKRWQDVLENFRIGGRLARGRDYAREGQVLSVEVRAGTVVASVQGSRAEPYDVTLAVAPLSPAQWDRVIESLARQALFVAKLLAGEMPANVEDVFTGSKLSLFPEKRGDLRTSCTCPDEANPCKHIAAVYYLLGEEFDRDPFLLFRLRGLEREELLARLKKGGPSADGPQAEPLPRDAGAFWASAHEEEDFGDVQAPPVTAGLVRRLGKFPFWRGEKPLADALEPAYVQASALGLEVFLGEHGRKE